MSVASRAILSTFFEEQCTQNHAQYLSGLSLALFAANFSEIARNREVILEKSSYKNHRKK